MTDHHVSQPVQGFPAGKKQRVLSTDDGDDDDDNDNKSVLNSTHTGYSEGSWNKITPSGFPHHHQGGSSSVGESDDNIEIVSIGSDNSETLPHPSYDFTESLIAQKMSNLSMQEREEVCFDIHSVNSPIDEDAESGFRERKLEEMEGKLLRIQSGDRKAYDMAHSTNSSYVEDCDFRLRFLRAERFDARLAAVRYARHYQVKLQFF
jgi:hypothetical protein